MIGLRCAAHGEIGFQGGAQFRRERHALVPILFPLPHNQPLNSQVDITQPQVADFTEPQTSVAEEIEPSAVACQSTG